MVLLIKSTLVMVSIKDDKQTLQTVNMGDSGVILFRFIQIFKLQIKLRKSIRGRVRVAGTIKPLQLSLSIGLLIKRRLSSVGPGVGHHNPKE
jgi:hypothetical protein